MKRKFLAALLALVMVFSMIPVSASAAGNVTVTGDDPITDNNRSVSFHLYTTQLYKLIMLEDNSATADSDVSGVSLLLYDGFGVLDRTELSLRKIGVTKAETDYFEYSNTNRGHALEPDNIKGLKISYSTGDSQKEIAIDASDLLLHCERGALNLTADYTIMSSNTDKSIVAFYDNGGNAQQVAYSLWDAYVVETNSTLGETNWPEDPDYIGESYTFFGWDEYKGGGKPFEQTSVVSGDTQVFSQKTTTTGQHSGLHIHVMNRENVLKKRFVELFNAANNDSITISNVSWDTTQITLIGDNGDRSNPQYNLGVTPNKWENDGEYYWVQNPDADEEAFGTPQYNKHIPPASIVAIEVAAEVDGEMSVVTINRGVNCGEFSVAFIDDELFEIVIQAAPTPPTDAELEDTGNDSILPDGAVTIDCTNEQANHTEETYSLIAGTYTVSDSATWVSDGSGSGYYTAEVTIDFDKVDQYVTKYATEYADVTHTLMPEQGDKKITLIWQNGKWVADNSAPVKYKVACETEPEEETPPAPNPTEFGISVTVACTNNPSDHAVKNYGLLADSYTLGTVTQNGTTYEYTITVQSEKYVEMYNTEYGPHELDAFSDSAITVTFIYSDEKWEIAEDSRSPVFFVTCAESGEEQPTPPSITPEDVITLMGDNAIKVVCETEGSEHNPSSYRLILGSFTVGTVTEGEDGTYSCEITIDEAGILQYVAKYSQTVDYEHTTGIYRGPITFTITYDGIKWLQPELPAATITVVCEADQEDELDEDDLNKILGGAITVQCVSEEDHGYKTLPMDELLENAYSFTKNENGTYTVTLDGEKYASAYGSYVSDKIGKGENIPHQLVNEENADFEIRLTYDGIKWTFDPDPIVIEVTCEDDSGDEPVEPTPTPTPDPTPTPTPTPDPGDDNNPPYNPPYIPPVDPDDSGVSDLLNTDDHIQYLFGYPEGTFGPENNMTRAEVAQMFYNLLLDQDVTITKTFDDVPANAWYAKAVNTLASLGVVSGVGNGDFEPERSITRAEFTSIAMKFAEGKTGGTNIFSDVKSTDWFYRAVVNSTQYGWIHGYGDGTFRPNNPITRVEVTAIVNNMLGREADVDFVTEHYDELNHFSDLAVSHWGYYHIVEATNDHDYTKPSSGENWTELN